MTLPPPARPGDTIEAIDTPALVVDLEAYEYNLARMARLVAASPKRLRPHAKTHKSPVVALDQIARGAVGVCCQKVSEAEVLVWGGVRDVFVSNEVVGAAKIARLAGLAAMARISVCVDDGATIAPLGAAATAAGGTLTVFVEVDVGGRRCGVTPEQAPALADAIAKTPGLAFGGLQAYHGGAQHIRDVQARRAAVRSAADSAQRAVEALEAAGIACPLVTGGGTGTLEIDLEEPVWGELQCGSYVFMDADYLRNPDMGDGAPDRFRPALFVLTTVMSVARPGQVVVDAGHKAAAIDSGLPTVHGRSGMTYTGASDEHGQIALTDGAAAGLGDRLMLVPGHCDPTVNLHDWFVGVRGGRVERVWPVAARGALF
jgi:3-hydroxy-D-aspartate aldolase